MVSEKAAVKCEVRRAIPHSAAGMRSGSASRSTANSATAGLSVPTNPRHYPVAAQSCVAPSPWKATRYFLFRAYVTSIAGQGAFLRRRRLRVRCAPACDRERANAAVKPNSCVVTSDRPSTVSQVRNDDGARTHCAPYTGLRYAHLRVPGLRSFGELGGAFRRRWLRYLRGHHGGGDVGLAPGGPLR
jgi:hypothetical protein